MEGPNYLFSCVLSLWLGMGYRLRSVNATILCQPSARPTNLKRRGGQDAESLAAAAVAIAIHREGGSTANISDGRRGDDLGTFCTFQIAAERRSFARSFATSSIA